jgi:hypothetical protein
MSPGRWPPSLVLDGQGLVTPAASVAPREQEMGHPPRLLRGPDLCDLFQARDAARRPGLVDRWASYGLAAQGASDPPPGGAIDPRPSSHTSILPRNRPAVTPVDWPLG